MLCNFEGIHDDIWMCICKEPDKVCTFCVRKVMHFCGYQVTHRISMLAKKAEPLKETTPLTDSVLEERFLFFPSKCWCIVCPF